jgi:hypothetical protein
LACAYDHFFSISNLLLSLKVYILVGFCVSALSILYRPPPNHTHTKNPKDDKNTKRNKKRKREKKMYQ